MTRVESGKIHTHDTGPFSDLSICFDLDGTLVDTAPDLVRVTNEVIALEGLPETDYALARAVVSLGSRRLITDALARADHFVVGDRVDALQQEFLRRYHEDIAQKSTPFPGAIQSLSDLTDLGASLSVCTNKPGWLARPLLDALDMTRWFDRIVGGDEAPAAKPDPSHIFDTAGHKHRGRIIMVGDSYPDMEAARRAGVYSVLMTFGYSHQPLNELRADTRLGTFRDLVPTLIDWQRRRKNDSECLKD